MNGLLLMDIDGTLFDSSLFGSKMRAEFINILGVGEDELARTIADYYAALEHRSDFNPREITDFVSKRYGVEKSLLDEVFWNDDKIYSESLFSEVDDVLKKLSKGKTLGVFSQGNEELQSRKLTAAGIKEYFDEAYIFIHSRKLSDEAIAVLPRGATVVDDSHDVAVTLATFVNTIWINRRTEDSDPEVKTIHLLSELIAD
jgi:FMN phosphatase YigB (HAD superfamily)